MPHVLGDGNGRVDAASLHHLRRVLRLPDGAAVSLTDGAGRRAEAHLRGDGLDVGPWSEPAPAPVVTLFAAVSKGRKLDLVVEKATEVGVAAVVPVLCERSERRTDATKWAVRAQRWRTIARSALEQSRRLWLPEVTDPVPFDRVVTAPPGGAAVLLHATGEGGARRILALAPTSVAVGPEGGFSPWEVAAATEGGWEVVGLGPHVLRTETAAMLAAGFAVAASGGLEPATEDPGPAGSNTRGG